MEKNERELWWKVIEECWEQDPCARPPIDTVAKKLMDLRQILFERIRGVLFVLEKRFYI
jgi:hypothetical protein